MRKNIKTYIFLHLIIVLYSVSSIFSKLASLEEAFSKKFYLYYFFGMILLGVYALSWQKIIKRMPLSVAYTNKAVTVLWGMLWGLLIFKEQFSLKKLFGVILIVGGIALFGTEQEP